MYTFSFSIFIVIMSKLGVAQDYHHEADLNFRVEAGSRTCFFEKGAVGQVMELYYQVLDGQHGDLDISVDVIDPNGTKLVTDYKKSQNSIIMELEHDGDYIFCLDNTYSVMNSKLVFVYVLIEDKDRHTEDTEVSTVDTDGQEHVEVEILEWIGKDEEGNTYAIAVKDIIETMKRTLKHVIHARHMLDIYGAAKARDSYLSLEDVFVVDVWSGFQIIFMSCVGVLQVYKIKKLFDSPYTIEKY